MRNLGQFNSIAIDPLAPIWILIVTLLIAVIAYIIYVLKGGKAKFLRLIFFSLLGILLLNPQIIKNQSLTLPNYVIVINDKSPSMTAADRQRGQEIANQRIQTSLNKIPNTKVINSDLYQSNGAGLLRSIESAITNINPKQVAGVILITDGLINEPSMLNYDFPIQQIIIGTKSEKDLFIKIVKTPIATEVGKNASLKIRIEDGGTGIKSTQILLHVGNETPRPMIVDVNKDIDIPIKVSKRGKNPVAIEIPPAHDEIATANNIITTEVDGIREHLRVLLVSGEPYEGLRAWRNLLKSDPNVDLVHFTILRTMEKDITAYDDEMSLIPFPTYELFNERLGDFDLIVFDKFTRIEALPDEYLQNVVHWVQNGGAFLALTGSSESENKGLSSTPIAQILPFTEPSKVIDTPFSPQLTDSGLSNPITAPFSSVAANWGQWTRIIAAKPRGNVLLSGDNLPLLVTSYQGKGRVAAVLSDKSWLWQRGYQGGGPFRELFRNTANWLMGEPALDSNQLVLNAENGGIKINLKSDRIDNLIFASNDLNHNISPDFDAKNQFTTFVPNLKSGLYKAFYGDLSSFIINGGGDEITGQDLRANGDILKNKYLKTPADAFYIGLGGNGIMPNIVLKDRNLPQMGNDLYLYNNKITTSDAIDKKPLINPILNAILIALLGIAMWWWEGKKHSV